MEQRELPGSTIPSTFAIVDMKDSTNPSTFAIVNHPGGGRSRRTQGSNSTHEPETLRPKPQGAQTETHSFAGKDGKEPRERGWGAFKEDAGLGAALLRALEHAKG